MGQRTSQEGLAAAGGAVDDEVLRRGDPLAGGETGQLRAIQSAARAQLDVLQASALLQLRELQERCGNLALQDHSRTFNTELTAALELGFMLDTAEAIVQSALRREESRGAHQRTDFPARNDQRFLAHSLVFRNPDGSCRVDYQPVTITRWPPGERVYGKG